MSFRKRDFLGYLALACMGLAGAIAIYYFGFAPHTFRLAVPPGDSEPAQLFNAMSAALKRDRASIRLTVVSYESNDAIVRALEGGQVDLAIARTDRPLPRSSLGVATVHEFVTLIFVRADSGIDSFTALKGRKVGELSRADPNEGVIAELMKFNALDREDIAITPVKSSAAIAAAVEEHNLDAVFVVAPRGSNLIAETVRALTQAFGAAPVLLALNENKAIATRISALEVGEIAAGEISAKPQLPAAATPTLTFPALLVARRQLANASVQDLTRQIFNVRNSLMARYPAASRLTSLDTERGASFAVHPGAAIYYDASEVSFLDRYSDLLWRTLFGFSTIVSAAVWFLRRLFPQQRELLREEHNELIGLLKHLRTTNRVADLDAGEARVDEIVAGLSSMSFNGKIDEEQQPAFELIIGRIGKVIEERRRILQQS